MALYPIATTGLAGGIFRSIRLIHSLPWRVQRVLQPEKTLDAFYLGKYHGPAFRLQEGYQEQWWHLILLHHLPDNVDGWNMSRPWQYNAHAFWGLFNCIWSHRYRSFYCQLIASHCFHSHLLHLQIWHSVGCSWVPQCCLRTSYGGHGHRYHYQRIWGWRICTNIFVINLHRIHLSLGRYSPPSGDQMSSNGRHIFIDHTFYVSSPGYLLCFQSEQCLLGNQVYSPQKHFYQILLTMWWCQWDAVPVWNSFLYILRWAC